MNPSALNFVIHQSGYKNITAKADSFVVYEFTTIF